MNKLIKKIIESLFDDDVYRDINDIYTASMSQEVLKSDIKKFLKLPCNAIEIPEGFMDIPYLEALYKVGYLYVDLYLNRIRENFRENEKKKLKIKCKLKNYDDTIDTDIIEIYGPEPYIDSDPILICSIQIDIDKHYIKELHFFKQECSTGAMTDRVEMTVYYAINIFLNKGFTIQKIILDNSRLYNNIKIVEINNCVVTDETTTIPIKSDYIETYKRIYIKQGNSELPINKVLKNSTTITFQYTNVFNDLKTFEDFLYYLKDMKYKKFKMFTQPLILNNTQYKDFKYGEDLFNYFIIDNNLEQYSFTKKSELSELIKNKIITYLNTNKKYNIPSYGYMNTCDFTGKGKDNHGDFINVTFCIDYDDKNIKNHTYKHIYIKIFCRFYKSGLLEIDNEKYLET